MDDDGLIHLSPDDVRAGDVPQLQAGQYVIVAGERCKVLSNGALYSMDRGRIAYGAGSVLPDTNRITSQNAASLAKRRRTLAAIEESEHVEAKRTGIIAALLDEGVELSTAAEADTEITRRLVRDVILSDDAPARSRVLFWRELWRAAGMMPADDAGSSEGARVAIQVNVGASLGDRYAGSSPAEVIDAE